MPLSGTKSLEMMVGSLLQATQDMQRDITEIRRDIKDSDARSALSYEQSESRAAQARAKMYSKTDELAKQFGKTESAVDALTEDMIEVKKVTADVTRWKLMGMGALGVTGIAAGSLASLVTYYWSTIVHTIRGY